MLQDKTWIKMPKWTIFEIFMFPLLRLSDEHLSGKADKHCLYVVTTLEEPKRFSLIWKKMLWHEFDEAWKSRKMRFRYINERSLISTSCNAKKKSNFKVTEDCSNQNQITNFIFKWRNDHYYYCTKTKSDQI